MDPRAGFQKFSGFIRKQSFGALINVEPLLNQFDVLFEDSNDFLVVLSEPVEMQELVSVRDELKQFFTQIREVNDPRLLELDLQLSAH